MGRRTGLDEYDDDLAYRKGSGSRVKRRDERNNNWNSTTSRKASMNNKDSLSMIALPTSSRKEIAVPKNLIYSRNNNNSDEERKRNNNNHATTTVINEKGEKINIKSVRVATATPTFDSIRKRQPSSTPVTEQSYNNNNMNDNTPDFAGNNIVFIMVANNILRRLEELEHQRMDTLNRGYSRCDGVSTLANDDYDIISNSEGDDSRISNYSLDDEMSFILPKHYRESFIYAVNSRIEGLSSHNSSSFILIEKRNDKYKRDADFLTRQCHGMGLGSYDYTVNPILGRIGIKRHFSGTPFGNYNSVARGGVCSPTNRRRTTFSQQVDEFDEDSEYYENDSLSHRNYIAPAPAPPEDDDDDNLELVKQKLQDELGEVIKIMEVSSRSDETFWRSQAIQLQKKLDVLNEKNKAEEKNDNNKGSTATTILSASLVEKNSILASTVTPTPLLQSPKQATSSSQKSILKTSSSSSPRRKSSKKEKSVTLSPVMSQKSDFSHISVQKVISTNKLQNVARVIAPATLPEGYEFEAKLGNQKFIARVPPGGVRKDQTFLTEMIELKKVDILVPLGEWRDDLCDCCVHGFFHPLLILSTFFPNIALGQIMTRNGLNWCGIRGHLKRDTDNTCKVTMLLFFTWALSNIGTLSFLFYEWWYFQRKPGILAIVALSVINVLYLLYTLLVVSNARRSLRMKYSISESIQCEDCCATMFCLCCTVAQMGRHTADFNTIVGVFCSTTGIPSKARVHPGPEIEFNSFTNPQEQRNNSMLTKKHPGSNLNQHLIP